MSAVSTMRALRELIAAEAEAAERRLGPAAGMMVQAVWFDAGPARPGRLWLAIHHLAVDGVSWRILVPDLAAAWQAIAAGQAVALPPRGTSFRRLGGAACGACAGRDSVAQELSFWRGMQSEPSLLLAAERLDPARDTLGTAGHLTLTLPAAVTEALLTRVPAAFHGGIDDVLLTGLALAVADWCRRHVQGADSCRRIMAAATRCCSISKAMAVRKVCVSGAVDLTRTVGWFTSLYPVRLDPGLLDLEEALSGGPALGRALKTIKEQLRAVPGKGLGYGLLRYLNDETAAELAGAAGAAARLQLSGPVRGRRGRRGLGAGQPDESATEAGCRAAGRRRSGAAAGAC